MRSLSCVGMLLGVGSAFVLAAPQQTVAPPVLSARTDLVTMAATVVDRRGRPVTGLIRDNFVVYDNGERRPIEFFTNEDVAATIGLVIDRSASMRARRDDVAAAAAAFATASNPLDEFFTVNFNESVWPGLPADVAFTQDTNLLRAVLLAAPARGMTALYDAIDRALDHLPLGTRDRKALIVVSDGGDNASAHSLGEVLARARTTNAVIYSVAFVDPDDHDAKPQVLRRLARETGGRAFSPGTPVEMATAFAQIAREIRAGYTIGFSPPESVDQGYRVIRVVADAGDRRALIVRTRAGYYADASGPVVR